MHERIRFARAGKYDIFFNRKADCEVLKEGRVNIWKKIKEKQQWCRQQNISFPQYVGNVLLSKAILLQNVKEELPYHHLFFHSLLLDPSKAFTGHYDDGNNWEDWMITVSEYRAILEQLYARNYVLVRARDLMSGRCRLPAGKIPLVLSFDDVNYYDYMAGHGFAGRMCVDENGRIGNEVDGRFTTEGDGPAILEGFLQEHPDFSWKGARGILSLTAYEGLLGWRNTDDPGLAALVEKLKEKGWEFACHSWGHHHRIYNYTYPDGRKGIEDMEKWFAAAKVLGKTDLFITPFGVDIRQNPRLLWYLQRRGFRYFFHVGTMGTPEPSGSSWFLSRIAVDGVTFRTRDYLMDAFYFNVSSLYDPMRTIPFHPYGPDAPSLVQHALACLHLRTAYVWGGMGKKIDNHLLNMLANEFPENYNAKTLWKLKRYVGKDYLGFDCSGLIKNFMMGGLHGFRFDRELDGNTAWLFAHAEHTGSAASLPEVPGLCLYMEGHVGIYVGGGQVVEATSNARFGFGVVQTSLSDRTWSSWFTCPGIYYKEWAK